MAAEGRSRVLVIDDHALVREGVKRLIDDQSDMEVIGEAGEGHAGVRLAQALEPDIALVDVSMPGLGGTEVTQMITDTCPGVRVIAVSRHNDGSFVRKLLDAGAVGYVLKQSASTELTRGIRAVAAGERYLDPSIHSVPSLSREPRPRDSTALAELTAQEERVLGMIALGHSNQETANLLSIELAQVIALRASAVSKAGLTTRGAIVRYAQERGWLGQDGRSRGSE